MSIEFLKAYRSVFWDFDGVIKDSVKVKSDAFEQLFFPFGKKVIERVRNHHEENGGMSRFAKLPIYIEWAGQNITQEMFDEYATRFSILVKQKVIDSKWVTGVFEYLSGNYNKQEFFLVTATPQQEIEDILISLKIDNFFKEVVGSPTKKYRAVEFIMGKYSILSESSVMIGDSRSDYNASNINNIQFVLRRTNLNKELQKDLNCLMLDNFL